MLAGTKLSSPDLIVVTGNPFVCCRVVCAPANFVGVLWCNVIQLRSEIYIEHTDRQHPVFGWP